MYFYSSHIIKFLRVVSRPTIRIRTYCWNYPGLSIVRKHVSKNMLETLMWQCAAVIYKGRVAFPLYWPTLQAINNNKYICCSICFNNGTEKSEHPCKAKHTSQLDAQHSETWVISLVSQFVSDLQECSATDCNTLWECLVRDSFDNVLVIEGRGEEGRPLSKVG